jgi:hypothetical protein
MESCLAAESDAGLLQFSVEFLMSMATQRHKKGGGTSMVGDFRYLMEVLGRNFEGKQEWRQIMLR